MDKKIILIGAFHEIVELCELSSVSIYGIIDNNIKNEFMGYKIIGKDMQAKNFFADTGKFPVLLSPDLPQARKRLYEYYKSIGYTFASLISPKSYVAPSAKIGKGVIVQSFANISSKTVIGDFVKLNTYSNVMHDSIVDKFSTLAPNCVVLGRVKIGMSCYVGSNSTVLPDLKIGNEVTIGAGAVVTKNVISNITVAGVPARKIGSKNQ